jgi:hypothetical protein
MLTICNAKKLWSVEVSLREGGWGDCGKRERQGEENR